VTTRCPGPSCKSRPREASIWVGRPSNARAAVAPSATTTVGLTRFNSRSSHHLQRSLACVGPLMDAALAARHILEVFDRIRDIHQRTVNAGLGKSAIEDATGRSHERSALQIFLIAGLLADEHDGAGYGPLAEHRLHAETVERAARAGDGFVAHRRHSLAGRRHVSRARKPCATPLWPAAGRAISSSAGSCPPG
jgi:hypothetical protein